MVRITRTEIYIKIVYYGPGLSGKTTNLEVIHKQLPNERRGDLTSIATETDRTIFFDCLPYEATSPDGRTMKLQLFTIPGQVYYRSTRQLILRGADGIVFVADSQDSKMEENKESLEDLYENLQTYRVDLEKMPLVLQYNKRDLMNLLALDDLEANLNTGGRPSFCASAINRIGITETLRRILRIIMTRLKLLPTEDQEEEDAHNRRKELVSRVSSGVYSTAEWVEFLGLHLDPRRRGPVGELVRDLKSVFRKMLKDDDEQLAELHQAIKSIDPGEREFDSHFPGANTLTPLPGEMKAAEPPSDPETTPAFSAPSQEGDQKSLSTAKPPVSTPLSQSTTETNPGLSKSSTAQKKSPSQPRPPQQKTSSKRKQQSTVAERINRLVKEVKENPENLAKRKSLLNLYMKNQMEEKAVEELMATAKIHFQNGKLGLCQKCLQYLLRLDPDHEEAKSFLEVLTES